MNENNMYSLIRQWFDFCFENPELINPNHSALYFFIIEHCNRLGWKEKFGLPMEMAKDAIGIKNFRTYAKAFNDLVDFGFIKVVQKSKNQYSANIIAIVKNTTATTKALDKAMHKHSQKQVTQQYNGSVYIDIPITNNTTIPITIYREFKHLKISTIEFDKLLSDGFTKIEIDDILDRIENFAQNKKYTSLLITARNWLKKEKNSGQKESKSSELIKLYNHGNRG